MKVDILAIGIHPDDVEMSCGGTLAKHVVAGKKVGILDLTRGEMGTRGTPQIRTQEANASAKILGASFRFQLNMADGFFSNDPLHQLQVIQQIRKHQPDIVLCNAVSDRHPDHARAANMTKDACFYSGLSKIETTLDGIAQKAWRPKAVYHYIQDQYIHPDFVIDVSSFVEVKQKAIMAFASQFYDPNSKEPQTVNTGKDFFDYVNSKFLVWGRSIGVSYAEGFTVNRYPGVDSLMDLL